MSRPFSAWELGLAFRYLRATRKEGGVALISIISFTAIALSVFALITVMSVMNGFSSELLGRIMGFNGHIYIQGPAIERPEREEMVARVRQIPGVVQVAPLVETPTLLEGPAQVQPGVVRGASRSTLEQTPLVVDNIKAGSIADFGKGDYGGDTILLGQRLAQSLGVEPGDPVTVISPAGGVTAFGSAPLHKTYVVGALFSAGMAEFDQAFAYMPLEQAQLFFGKEQQWDVVEVKIVDPGHPDALRARIAQVAGPDATVSDWRDKNASYWGAIKVERNVMRLILMIIVAIAAMNIVSGIVMLVKNKGKDIAILRTMGASRSAVTRIFFIAGSAIGAAGTLTGLVLGVLFCLFIRPIQQVVEAVTGAKVFNPDVYYLSYIPARVEWTEVAFVVLWSLLAACLAALWPALRGSRLDPVEALRYE